MLEFATFPQTILIQKKSPIFFIKNFLSILSLSLLPYFQVSKDLQYLTYIFEAKSIPRKISGNSGMVHFAEINQTPFCYSMLQHIGRLSTP